MTIHSLRRNQPKSIWSFWQPFIANKIKSTINKVCWRSSPHFCFWRTKISLSRNVTHILISSWEYTFQKYWNGMYNLCYASSLKEIKNWRTFFQQFNFVKSYLSIIALNSTIAFCALKNSTFRWWLLLSLWLYLPKALQFN